MRIANQEKISLKKRHEEIGKPKLIGTHYNENGLTAVQPFRFLTEDRPDRIKDLKSEAKSTSSLTSRAPSPREIIRKELPLQSKLKIVKLFDVDVKIAKDQVIRI